LKEKSLITCKKQKERNLKTNQFFQQRWYSICVSQKKKRTKKDKKKG